MARERQPEVREVWLALVGAAIAASASSPATVAAQERSYGIFTGSIGELADAADAHVRALHADVKVNRMPEEVSRGEGNPVEAVRATVVYKVPRTIPVPWGKPGETQAADLTVVGVHLIVYRPSAGGRVPPGGLEPELRRHAFEGFEGMWRDDVQWKAAMRAELLPEKGTAAGSYHFYLLDDRLEILAGNVRITARAGEEQNFKVHKVARPDLRALGEAILARLPGGLSTAGKLQILPVMTGASETVGLVPAAERFPARVTFSGARPGEEVRFALDAAAPGELRAAGSSGREVVVRADGAGQAIAHYHYLPSGKPLVRPLKLRVSVTAGGKTLAGEIHVGLGLAFDKQEVVQGQTYENDTHAFSLTVKSGFHPTLVLADYLTRAELAKVWPDSVLGLRLYAEWMNRPDGAVYDDAFRGTVTLVHGKGKGEEQRVFLVAQNQPWYGAPGGAFYYPAIEMRSGGAHAYRLSARGAVLGSAGSFIDFLHEAMVQGESLLVVSRENPEAWYQSLACSLNARTEAQYMMLEAVKLVPAYGAIADKATAVSGLVCGLLGGDTEKSLLELASWLGAQYIDNLMEPAVFDKLSLVQQDAVLAAKAATTGAADNFKRKQDVDALRRASQ
jgi:hypothetical protein